LAAGFGETSVVASLQRWTIGYISSASGGTMHTKSLALVAAVALTAGAAQAADLNKAAKVAVDYVKVCDAYGPGFFYIPGSDTCIQISGYVRERWEAGTSKSIIANGVNSTYLGPFGGSPRSRSNFGSFTEIELDVDTRTKPDFGLLRGYESIEVDYNSSTAGGGASTINLNRGFLQWGGLTAGRIESNFTFFQGYNDEVQFSELGADYQTNAISYTFTLGNGVTANIGLEDSTTGGQRVASTGGSFVYQGNKTPDVVGYVNVTQAWGQAQISGALHQAYGNTNAAGTGVNVSKEGYALLAGIWFNVPTFGAGDKIGFQGTYTQGAFQYTSAGEVLKGLAGTDIGTDASTYGGTSKLNTAWNLYTSFVHNFSPAVSLAVGGGFEGYNGYDGLYSTGTKVNYTEGEVGATLEWHGVKGLSIGLELEYANTSFNSAAKNLYNSVNNNNFAGQLKNGDSFVYGVQIKRSF